MIKENVQVVDATPIHPTKGNAGLQTQLSGYATTVSNVAAATGGIGRGRLVECDTK